MEAPSEPGLGSRLVFVVGARRSGTNWLQRALGAHPEVAGVNGESFLFSRGVRPLLERFHHSSPGTPMVGSMYADRTRLIGAVRGLCDTVFGDLLDALGPARLLVDRTPEHVTCLDLIGDVYPDAAVLHIIRDGRDVVRSLLSMPWGPDDPAVAAEEWRAAVVDGRRAGHALARYREVRYESMLADPGPVLDELTAWLGLETSAAEREAMLAEAARPFTVDPRSTGIGSGKWKDGLDVEALATLQGVAGDALQELGYAGGEVATPPRASRRAWRGPRNRTTAASRGTDTTLALRDRLVRVNTVAGQLLDALASSDTDRMVALLSPAFELHLSTPSSNSPSRGQAAVDALRAWVAGDEVLRWRQARSELLLAVPTTTVVAAYRAPDGRVASRVVAVTVGESGAVDRLTVHHLDA